MERQRKGPTKGTTIIHDFSFRFQVWPGLRRRLILRLIAKLGKEKEEEVVARGLFFHRVLAVFPFHFPTFQEDQKKCCWKGKRTARL